MQSKATMVGKGTCNHTERRRVSPHSPRSLKSLARPTPHHPLHQPPHRNGARPQQPGHPLPSSQLQGEGGTYRSRGVFPPDETVQDEADPEDDPRVQGGCLQEQPQVRPSGRPFSSTSPLLGSDVWRRHPFCCSTNPAAGPWEDLRPSSSFTCSCAHPFT